MLTSIRPPANKMMTKTIPLNEWRPDLADIGNPGLTVALNVVPFADGYGPFPTLSAQSDAINALCLGTVAANDADNNTYVYAGDATKLYEMTDYSWSDESGTTYSTVTGDVWEFAVFGNTVIATNFTDPVQSISIGGGGAGAFGDLITSTNKPKAKHIDIVRDFVVLGNTSDASDGHKPNRIWWSAINDSTDFDPAQSTQCDYNDFPDGGWIQRVVGGVEYGLVFQERAISRMTYVGTPLIFQIDAIDRKRGTPIPNSVVGFGRLVFFISEDGFYYTDGTQSVPIGQDAVDQTFWAQFDVADKHRVSAAIDPVNKVVAWAFPGSGNSGGTPNKLYLYSYGRNRWSEVDIDVDIICRTFTQGYTLEGLDTISTDIDAGFTESFDSDVWKGNLVRFGGFDTNHKLGFFNGSNLAARFETAAFQAGNRMLVNGVRPIVNGGTTTCSIASVAAPTDTFSYGSVSSPNSNGLCTLLSEGRYHKIRATVAAKGDWTKAQALEVMGSLRGDR